jgi:hypothetical protein
MPPLPPQRTAALAKARQKPLPLPPAQDGDALYFTAAAPTLESRFRRGLPGGLASGNFRLLHKLGDSDP